MFYEGLIRFIEKYVMKESTEFNVKMRAQANIESGRYPNIQKNVLESKKNMGDPLEMKFLFIGLHLIVNKVFH